MTRSHWQNLALLAVIAALLAAVVQAYQVQKARMPFNLEGHAIIDGSMTANPPTAPPSMQ